MRRIIPLLLMAALFAACGSKVEITNLTVEMQDGRLPNATGIPPYHRSFGQRCPCNGCACIRAGHVLHLRPRLQRFQPSLQNHLH